MTLVRLTYYSRNLLDRLNGPTQEQINAIVIKSVANNRRDEVTGALIHDGQWFAQALEGPEPAVSNTFERILRDRRHGEVKLIKMQPVETRRFGACWMACVDRDEANAALFQQHCESDRFDPRLMRPDRLGDLIEAVVARAGVPQGAAARAGGNVTNAA